MQEYGITSPNCCAARNSKESRNCSKKEQNVAKQYRYNWLKQVAARKAHKDEKTRCREALTAIKMRIQVASAKLQSQMKLNGKQKELGVKETRGQATRN